MNESMNESMNELVNACVLCRSLITEICALPIDAMAHARDESGQEHERFPVWRFFTCDTAHVTVGPAVALKHTPEIHFKS